MRYLLRVFSLSLALVALGFSSLAAADSDLGTRVFTMSNAADGNQIIEFVHFPEKGLMERRRARHTGGLGIGGIIGNQEGLVVNRDARLLFVVNAGSDSLSVFKITRRGLRLIDVEYSLGERPVSIAQHGNLVYVLNAGSDTIAGFTIDFRGELDPMYDSVRTLSGTGTGAAQISFTPRGDALVVTERATKTITTFLVDSQGLPGTAVVNESAGITPFGFSFDRHGHLLISEANGGADNASTVSTYDIHADGTLSVLHAALPTDQSAACWLVTSRDGRHAFITNTRSSNITALDVDASGTLSLVSPNGVDALTGEGSGPLDMALSPNGQFAYVLSARDGTISAFEVNGSALESIPGADELPTSVNGLATF